MPLRSGFVSILGRPNAGKSTLVNALVGEKVAGLTFAVELHFLKGRERFDGLDVFGLLHYNE